MCSGIPNHLPKAHSTTGSNMKTDEWTFDMTPIIVQKVFSLNANGAFSGFTLWDVSLLIRRQWKTVEDLGGPHLSTKEILDEWWLYFTWFLDGKTTLRLEVCSVVEHKTLGFMFKVSCSTVSEQLVIFSISPFPRTRMQIIWSSEEDAHT